MIYMFLKSNLGPESTEPIDALDLACFRLVGMFCACTTESVKSAILSSFCSPASKLRGVVATIAFGKGLDCPNVRQVIHWGPSEDIEQYVQETGRAGRDGMDAYALLYSVSLPGVIVEESMNSYCLNMQTCRRKLILAHFDQTDDITK